MNNKENGIYKLYKTEGLKYYAKDNMGEGENEIVGYAGNFGFLQKVIEENQKESMSCIEHICEMEKAYLVDRLGFALHARNVITDFLTFMFKNDPKYNPNYNNCNVNEYQKSNYESKIFNTQTFAKKNNYGEDDNGVKHEYKLDILSESLQGEFRNINQYGVYLFQKCVQGYFSINYVPNGFVLSDDYLDVIELFDTKHIGNEKFINTFTSKSGTRTQMQLRQLYLLCNEVHRFVSEEIHGDDGLKVSDEMPYKITDENFEFYYKLLYNFMWLICKKVYPDSMKGIDKIVTGKIMFDRCLIGTYVPFLSIDKDIKYTIPLPPLTDGRKYYIRIDEKNVGDIYIFSDEEDKNRLSGVLQKISDQKIRLGDLFLINESYKCLENNEKTVKHINRIPGYPITDYKRLSCVIRDKESIKDIFEEITDTVDKLHKKGYAFRNIRIDSFVICKIEDEIRLVYWNPKTIKGASNNGLTVIKTVANKKDHYMAPNVRDDIRRFEEEHDTLTEENLDEYKNFIFGTDISDEEILSYWKKADRYALGMLGVFLFLGKTYENITEKEIEEIKDSKDIPEECAKKILNYLIDSNEKNIIESANDIVDKINNESKNK